MPTVLCVGHAVQDFVFYVPALPDRGEKYRATRFESVGGGPAATAAVAIARLGGRAVLAARVGDDAAAEMIRGELLAHGVDCGSLRRCPGCSSSASAVIVDAQGERMIVNHLDPALPAEPSWLPAAESVGACGRARGHALARRRARRAARRARSRPAGRARCRPPDPGRRGVAARGDARRVLGRCAGRLHGCRRPGPRPRAGGVRAHGLVRRDRGAGRSARAGRRASCGITPASTFPWSTRSARATSGMARSRWRSPRVATRRRPCGSRRPQRRSRCSARAAAPGRPCARNSIHSSRRVASPDADQKDDA